jgi:hypothetical protein
MVSTSRSAAATAHLLLMFLISAAGLAVGEANGAQLTVSWADNSNGVATTRLERRLGTDLAFTAIADVRPGVTEYVDVAVSRGTTYCYRALAYDADGVSAYCNEVCAIPGSNLNDLNVTVSKAGDGAGTVASAPGGILCGTDCSETYLAGSAVTLTAIPAAGSTFAGWSGGGCAGSEPCTVAGKGPVTVTATFTTATATFVDVPMTQPFFPWVEELADAGITVGCWMNPRQYCPDSGVTRDEMAVFVLRGVHGAAYQPPVATGIFTDVPVTDPLANWVEQLAREGFTAGCAASSAKYCPDAVVTRAQMPVFLLRAKYGASYTPPAPTGMFTDVPVSHPLASWIEQLAREGIITGCGPTTYCPDETVMRGQMAVFLVRTFGLDPA